MNIVRFQSIVFFFYFNKLIQRREIVPYSGELFYNSFSQITAITIYT